MPINGFPIFQARYTDAEAVAAVEADDPLSPANLILPNAAAPAPTTEALILWDSDDDIIVVGDGSATLQFHPSEYGTWTPAITFATAGDLSVVYSRQNGHYAKTGNWVQIWWDIITSTFTHSTASGALHMTGLPFTGAGMDFVGVMGWQGITNAALTQINPIMTSAAFSELRFHGYASGAGISGLGSGDLPTGGTVRLVGLLGYKVA